MSMQDGNIKNACLIIGCGNIAAKHAAYLRGKIPLYFYSKNIEHSKSYNDKFEGKGFFKNWDEVLRAEKISNWIICSSLDVHHDQIISGVELNKTILCEKPLCRSRAELIDIVKKLNDSSNHSRVMVAENYYYKPMVTAIKSIINKGSIGSIQELYLRKEFTQASHGWRESYGALIEGGIHFIAFANAIIEGNVLKVSSLVDTSMTPERTSKTEISYENNIRAEISYSWAKPSLTKGLFQHSRLVGSKGTILFESNGIYLFQKRPCMKILFPNLSDINGEKAMLNDFLKFINDTAYVPISSFENAVRDLNIVFDAYEANGL